MGDQLYYMQDKRQYVGNSMYWWAKDHKGYTCDIRKAHIFTANEAIKATHRDTDVLWPIEYINERVSHHIDAQHCRVGFAFAVDMETALKRSQNDTGNK